jgi:GNAT superfamily N-acetyltransferase
MLATHFLPMRDFKKYGDWLREQSEDTLAMYFGVATSPDFITNLVDRILSNPDEHYFLVATRGTKWVGVIHMARISETDMEFGIMVADDSRHQGIADQLMKEAINWIQNRGFDTLYLHCLNRNSAMKHLALKHGLELHEEYGDIEAITHVPPPSMLSYIEEALVAQKNIFFLNLKNTWAPFTEILG